jgi:hypothetical protein
MVVATPVPSASPQPVSHRESADRHLGWFVNLRRRAQVVFAWASWAKKPLDWLEANVGFCLFESAPATADIPAALVPP